MKAAPLPVPGAGAAVVLAWLYGLTVSVTALDAELR
jgi:hypothetical protein